MYLETGPNYTLSIAQAITTTANSTGVFDVTGAGVGNNPNMIGSYGLTTNLATDIGAADNINKPSVVISSSVAGTGTGTVTISMQSAPDNGSYSPGTWTTIFASEAFVGTSIALNELLLQFPVPPSPDSAADPRFYRLVYTVSGTLTATLSAYIVLNAPNMRQAVAYGPNFVSLI